jgi:hypothetical protein
MPKSPTRGKRPNGHRRRARIIAQLHEQSNANVIDLFAREKAHRGVRDTTVWRRRVSYCGLAAVVIGMISVAAYWRRIVG